jgi:hypothetical protein
MNQGNTPRNTQGSEALPPFFRGLHVPINPYVFLVVLAIAFCLSMGDSFAQETIEPISEERIVTGTGEISDENVAGARNKAILQAFSRAIEEYLVQKLGFRGMATNFQRLDEEILARAKEQIQDYQILSEFKTDRYVRVLLKARVNTAVLEKILKYMRVHEREAIQVDVLFLVSEKSAGSPARGWWTDPAAQASLTYTELFLGQVFEDKGFRVINRSFFPPEESYDEDMLRIELSDDDAIKWGKLLSAQVVITGQANRDEESGASVFLKALRVMNGTTLAQGFREERPDKGHEDEGTAVELAIRRWADDLSSYITNAFKPSEQAMNRIFITLKGLKSYKELQDIKEFFSRDFPEVKSVTERRLQRDFVRVSVELKGDSQRLAERMLLHPKRPFLFEIREVDTQGFTVVRR